MECDLKSFFDKVNHDCLMKALKGKVRCPKTLRLIQRYLTAGVQLPDVTREATPQGVPQGGLLSPLLANIVLDPLDKELESRSRKSYPTSLKLRRARWQMSQNEIVRHALNNRWLKKQGVPDTRAIWIALYYPEQA